MKFFFFGFTPLMSLFHNGICYLYNILIVYRLYIYYLYPNVTKVNILQCNISRCCSVEIFLVIKMQQVNFETSMKNIPLGGKKEYIKQLTQSVRKVVYAKSKDLLYFVMDCIINREIAIDCIITSVRLPL